MALTQQPDFNLTPKQRAFANAYIETGSAPEAALNAYNCSSRNSARVMAHRTLNNAKVQAYLSSQVTDKVVVDNAIDTLIRQIHATKFMKVGNKVIQVPDNMARLKAVEFYIKLVMNLPTGIETQETASEDDYWETWYMQEHGGMRPTASELEKFKEARDDVGVEEAQTCLFSSQSAL